MGSDLRLGGLAVIALRFSSALHGCISFQTHTAQSRERFGYGTIDVTKVLSYLPSWAWHPACVWARRRSFRLAPCITHLEMYFVLVWCGVTKFLVTMWTFYGVAGPAVCLEAQVLGTACVDVWRNAILGTTSSALSLILICLDQRANGTSSCPWHLVQATLVTCSSRACLLPARWEPSTILGELGRV